MRINHSFQINFLLKMIPPPPHTHTHTLLGELFFDHMTENGNDGLVILGLFFKR